MKELIHLEVIKNGFHYAKVLKQDGKWLVVSMHDDTVGKIYFSSSLKSELKRNKIKSPDNLILRVESDSSKCFMWKVVHHEPIPEFLR